MIKNYKATLFLVTFDFFILHYLILLITSVMKLGYGLVMLNTTFGLDLIGY